MFIVGLLCGVGVTLLVGLVVGLIDALGGQ